MTIRTRKRLSVEPVVAYVHRMTLFDEEATVAAIARAIATRLGTDSESERRWLGRVLGGHYRWMTIDRADKVAMALGGHLGDPEWWGEEYYPRGYTLA